MPEGPSIVILKEAVQAFKRKKIIHLSGNSKIGIDKLDLFHNSLFLLTSPFNSLSEDG